MGKDKNLIKSSFKIITNRYIYGLEFFDKIQRQLPALGKGKVKDSSSFPGSVDRND
ncbi:MAG: hypothetical protein UT14_C0034G0002 [Candidatus Shapirobacteria bacterium GW2011_GWE1_38_92]|uniref:Uncharacterized protein n=1 Tax=Candidatus Shapirobacteria bacterium GW2011_GWE1_38_92 TaxID=1618489 RepID=A0A0G0LF90_9BACT|nr:MAG: hypothetical protein UT14_C0034G0002 [Candidatus Shapirobacteria bacterium GW2011_GWE1_38_92]